MPEEPKRMAAAVKEELISGLTYFARLEGKLSVEEIARSKDIAEQLQNLCDLYEFDLNEAERSLLSQFL